jgi:hypothetical protein
MKLKLFFLPANFTPPSFQYKLHSYRTHATSLPTPAWILNDGRLADKGRQQKDYKALGRALVQSSRRIPLHLKMLPGEHISFLLIRIPLNGTQYYVSFNVGYEHTVSKYLADIY